MSSRKSTQSWKREEKEEEEEEAEEEDDGNGKMSAALSPADIRYKKSIRAAMAKLQTVQTERAKLTEREIQIRQSITRATNTRVIDDTMAEYYVQSEAGGPMRRRRTPRHQVASSKGKGKAKAKKKVKQKLPKGVENNLETLVIKLLQHHGQVEGDSHEEFIAWIQTQTYIMGSLARVVQYALVSALRKLRTMHTFSEEDAHAFVDWYLPPVRQFIMEHVKTFEKGHVAAVDANKLILSWTWTSELDDVELNPDLLTRPDTIMKFSQTEVGAGVDDVMYGLFDEYEFSGPDIPTAVSPESQRGELLHAFRYSSLYKVCLSAGDDCKYALQVYNISETPIDIHGSRSESDVWGSVTAAHFAHIVNTTNLAASLGLASKVLGHWTRGSRGYVISNIFSETLISRFAAIAAMRGRAQARVTAYNAYISDYLVPFFMKVVMQPLVHGNLGASDIVMAGPEGELVSMNWGMTISTHSDEPITSTYAACNIDLTDLVLDLINIIVPDDAAAEREHVAVAFTLYKLLVYLCNITTTVVLQKIIALYIEEAGGDDVSPAARYAIFRDLEHRAIYDLNLYRPCPSWAPVCEGPYQETKLNMEFRQMTYREQEDEDDDRESAATLTPDAYWRTRTPGAHWRARTPSAHWSL